MIGNGFDEDDYRAREWIRHNGENFVNDKKFDAEPDDPTADGRLMLALDDEDNATGKQPHFTCETRYYNGDNYEYDCAGFTVSYARDENGNFIIKNTDDGLTVTIKGVSGTKNRDYSEDGVQWS